MIIDIHAHAHHFRYPDIWKTDDPDPVRLAIKFMDEAGVAKAGLVAHHFTCHEYIAQGDFHRANNEVLNAVERYPGRFLPFVYVHPRFGEQSTAEIDRCMKQYPCRGIKVHPTASFTPANSPLMDPLIEKARQYAVPVYMHTGHTPFGGPILLFDIAQRFKDVNFILGHLGMERYYPDAITAGCHTDNIFIETSFATPFAVESAIKKVGADRVVWGTDNPVLDPKYLLFMIDLMKITDQEKEKYLGLNAKRLLKIEE